MKIAFVWTGLTSYMADCWRQLASEPDVELKIWIDVSGGAAKAVSFDAAQVMRNLDYVLVDSTFQTSQTSQTFQTFHPDILFVVGWHSPFCRAVVQDERLKDVPKICCFDMPWRWKLRCLLAPLVLGRFLRGYRAAFVPGAVCARYAKWLGFKRVYKGLFAIDTNRFFWEDLKSQISNRRAQSSEVGGQGLGAGSRNYLLYIGRNSGEKRLGDLREAYRRYRTMGGTLELRMYGKGLDGGFVTPEEVPALMRGAAAFVLASDFDPWPLVLLEAMSAGCPVIASDRCTNRPELGKNWRVFKVGDVEPLAKLMMDAERRRNDERVVESVVKEYDCQAWVKRVRSICGLSDEKDWL